MMVSWKVLSTLFLFGCQLCYAQGQLKIMTEDWPPMNYRQDGVAAGPAVELVNTIAKNLNQSSTIILYPWKRAYRHVLKTPNTVLFSMSRTHEREHLFRWVGPIAHKKYAFFAKAGSGIELHSVEEAKKYSVAVQNGGVTEAYINRQHVKEVVANERTEQNLHQLIKGRVGLWYEGNSTVYATIEKEGLASDIVEEVLVVSTQPLYIAFHIDTAQEVIDSWQAELLRLYEGGEMASIYRKHQVMHLMPDMYPNVISSEVQSH